MNLNEWASPIEAALFTLVVALGIANVWWRVRAAQERSELRTRQQVLTVFEQYERRLDQIDGRVSSLARRMLRRPPRRKGSKANEDPDEPNERAVTGGVQDLSSERHHPAAHRDRFALLPGVRIEPRGTRRRRTAPTDHPDDGDHRAAGSDTRHGGDQRDGPVDIRPPHLRRRGSGSNRPAEPTVPRVPPSDRPAAPDDQRAPTVIRIEQAVNSGCWWVIQTLSNGQRLISPLIGPDKRQVKATGVRPSTRELEDAGYIGLNDGTGSLTPDEISKLYKFYK